MNIKTGIFAAIVVAFFPLGAKAQDVNRHEIYSMGCESSVKSNDFNIINYEKTEDNGDLAQTIRNRRTRRERKSSDGNQFYASGNIGTLFVGEGLNTGFGFGGLFGYKITEKFSAELEIFDYFGGFETDDDDLGYNFLGVAVNGVYKFSFGKDSKSLYAFLGLGLGFRNTSVTGDSANDFEDAGFETSDNSILIHGKVGIGFPITDKVDLTGQFRRACCMSGELFDEGNVHSLDGGIKYA